MPELPEVQTTVDGLNARVLNRTFVSVWSDWEKIVKQPKDFSAFKKTLKGKKIIKVWRRAKNVILDLSDGHSLLIHMKMTGHLLVGRWKLRQGVWRAANHGPLQDKINGFLHIVFTLDDGRMIALSDMRKFAKIELRKTQDLLDLPEFKNLGPESLEKTFTFEKFAQALKGKRGKAKQVIMRQEVIAGIGNIYASEALWWAKIHPAREISGLTREELKALYSAIKKVLSKGIEFGGDSFSDYRDVDGRQGKFEQQKRVYQNKGNPCARCKTPIAKMVIAARGTFFCPTCQKL